MQRAIHLQKENMTPQPNQLWNLGGQLFDFLEERDRCVAAVSEAEAIAARRGPDGMDSASLIELDARRQELDVINSGIAAFVQNKLQEVDELRTPLIALERAVALNKADALAATNRAMVLQNRYDKLKDLIKLAMETLAANGFWKPKQSRKFESARGSFLLKGNGGSQPVEITDETLVPDEYCRVTVTMTAMQWAMIVDYIPPFEMPSDPPIKIGPREVSKSAVAEALNFACYRCDGNGVVEAWGDPDEDADHRPAENPCTGCGGSGKNGVPGCRLAERGTAVIIK